MVKQYYRGVCYNTINKDLYVKNGDNICSVYALYTPTTDPVVAIDEIPNIIINDLYQVSLITAFAYNEMSNTHTFLVSAKFVRLGEVRVEIGESIKIYIFPACITISFCEYKGAYQLANAIRGRM